MKKYVAYLRVSTKGQERSGSGLEAQRAIIHHYTVGLGAEIIEEFVETESGKEIDNRPLLHEAIHLCNSNNYILVVAKLDRLSRDVQDTFAILKQLNNKLVCCDIPTQNDVLDTFTLALFAGLAQREREIISIRTKQALQAKKARGVKLGTPSNLTNEARRKGVEAIKKKAKDNKNNRLATALIEKCKREQMTLQQIAEELNNHGFKTAREKSFNRISVSRLVSQLK